MDFKVLINGVVFSALDKWQSTYMISEDLPYIAEEITLSILKKLEEYNYIVIKEEVLGRVL